jgi:arsenate reductase-like glutaredoxin family protein
MSPGDGYPPRMPSSSPPAGLQVQIFGFESDQATRAAIRFFKERRITIHLVDIRRKPIAAGELRRFVERLGAPALADREGKAWREAGLGYLTMTDAELAERLLADTRLLRLPLVRFGNAVSAGRAEGTWKEWLSARA